MPTDIFDWCMIWYGTVWIYEKLRYYVSLCWSLNLMSRMFNPGKMLGFCMLICVAPLISSCSYAVWPGLRWSTQTALSIANTLEIPQYCIKLSTRKPKNGSLVICPYFHLLLQASFDVFNALDLMDNKEFLEKLKFGIGDGNLQYYLYNWRCPGMNTQQVRGLTPGQEGCTHKIATQFCWALFLAQLLT